FRSKICGTVTWHCPPDSQQAFGCSGLVRMGVTNLRAIKVTLVKIMTTYGLCSIAATFSIYRTSH
ncbi:MAG: hypothetical protein PHH28_16745, partial [Desulfuromonadaceae bacterium]|nr:hypothetical protein [Desulfuromonadaceae bacterium]